MKSIATFLYYVYVYEVTEKICPARSKIDDTIFTEKLDPMTKNKYIVTATVGDASVIE